MHAHSKGRARLHENAIFLAERVCAENACDASKLLLATCHYAAGAANRAVVVLQGCSAPHNRYLLALSCMRLGRLPEAQTALLGPAAPDTDAAAQNAAQLASFIWFSPVRSFACDPAHPPRRPPRGAGSRW